MTRLLTARAVLGAVALAGALVLSACTINIGTTGDGGNGSGDRDGSSMMNGGDSMMDGRWGTVDAAAVMFAQMMIPHHEQAVEMSTLAETRAADPFIVQLAAEIKAAQLPEIDEMTSWLEEWGIPVMNRMDAMSAHGGHGMGGMLSDEQMDELAAAMGAEFDRLYAVGMIEHHEGAIRMTEPVVDSRDSRVAALARAIITTQEREIAAMKGFLARE